MYSRSNYTQREVIRNRAHQKNSDESDPKLIGTKKKKGQEWNSPFILRSQSLDFVSIHDEDTVSAKSPANGVEPNCATTHPPTNP